MVDRADPGFYGAAWRFADFCQQLFAGSVYLQFVLKSSELETARPRAVGVSAPICLAIELAMICDSTRKRLFVMTQNQKSDVRKFEI